MARRIVCISSDEACMNERSRVRPMSLTLRPGREVTAVLTPAELLISLCLLALLSDLSYLPGSVDT